MREIKNAFNGLISKLNWAREKISEVEDKSVETTPPKNTERKETEEQNKQDFQEVCNIEECDKYLQKQWLKIFQS